MLDIMHVHALRVDLNDGLVQRKGFVLLGQGDEAADEFQIEIYKGGVPAAGEATGATAYFIRPDGTTVILEGEVNTETGLVTVDLRAECYDYTGTYALTIKLGGTDGSTGVVSSAVIIDGRILETLTSTVADPGSVWSLDSIWAAVNGKISNPATPGTSGQALLTDGEGGVYWGSAPAASAVSQVIVDNVTYTLRTGTEGAAGYITLVEE